MYSSPPNVVLTLSILSITLCVHFGAASSGRRAVAKYTGNLAAKGLVQCFYLHLCKPMASVSLAHLRSADSPIQLNADLRSHLSAGLKP
jgi:hypothetical protein